MIRIKDPVFWKVAEKCVLCYFYLIFFFAAYYYTYRLPYLLINWVPGGFIYNALIGIIVYFVYMIISYWSYELIGRFIIKDVITEKMLLKSWFLLFADFVIMYVCTLPIFHFRGAF